MRPSDDPFRLFVYGTLMRGGCRHHLLAGQRLLGEASTRPGYALYHLGDYPGMVACPDGGVVWGELYAVEQRLLPRLDQEEGSPSWFCLGPVEVADGGEAWTYYFRQGTAGRPLCAGGRWSNGGGP